MIILAFAAAAYLYLNFLIFPTLTRASELKMELGHKQQLAGDKENTAKRLEKLNLNIANSQKLLDKIEDKIPYSIKEPELIFDIDSEIKKLGMDFESISIGEVDKANAEYGTIPINIVMKGKYDNVLDFLKYIENNDRKFIIDGFTLNPENRQEPMEFNITMRTFVLKDSKKGIAPDPADYDFFRNNKGKEYPFLEVFIKDDVQSIEKQIDEYKSIDDLINEEIKKKLGNSLEGGEGN